MGRTARHSRSRHGLRRNNYGQLQPVYEEFPRFARDRHSLAVRIYSSDRAGLSLMERLLTGPGPSTLTPLDFTWDLGEKTKLDTIYIHNMPNSDWWLKPINDRDKYVTQEQENGAILYLTDKSTPTQFEGYFMYKNNNPVDNPLSERHSLFHRPL